MCTKNIFKLLDNYFSLQSLFFFNRPGGQEYEIWLLHLSSECGWDLSAATLASHGVLQIPNSARL